MIRKIGLSLLSLVVATSMVAEGYQLNTQSARQMGMGHLGSALNLGAESMLFNPAGLTTMSSRVEAIFGVTAISSKVEYKKDSYSAITNNPIGTPIYGYLGVGVTDNLFAGISVTNPAGNSLVWPDNWRGTHFVQDISLQAFSIQPTLSYKICDKVSVGAGLMVNLGSFELNRGVLPIGSFAPLLEVTGFPEPLGTIVQSTLDISTLNANLSGKSKVTFGYNVGVLYSPTEKLNLGVSYRSKVMMKLDDGIAALSYGDPSLSALFDALTGDPSSPLFNQQVAGALMLDGLSFKAALPIPANLQLGVAYYPTAKWLVSAEAQYVFWSAYDKLEMEFENPLLNTTQDKNFKNSFTYRVGTEYIISPMVTARAGAIYDTTPVDKTLYTPETPGANKVSLTAGVSIRAMSNLVIDLACQYLMGERVNGSAPSQPTPFTGEYKSTAILPSIGISLSL